MDFAAAVPALEFSRVIVHCVASTLSSLHFSTQVARRLKAASLSAASCADSCVRSWVVGFRIAAWTPVEKLNKPRFIDMTVWS